MARQVAFLRGMNLGGRRIANEELAAACGSIGLADVATFRASGNVVFEAPDGEDPGELAAKVEAGLLDALGYEVPVFLRSGAQVAAIAAFDPFEPALVEASAGRLQVALLPAEPGRIAAREALQAAGEEDRLVLRDSELYWLPSGPTRESGLDLKALEALLGPWTMRTKATIEQIAAKHLA